MAEDRGPRLRNICAIFMALAVFSTAVRCYVRARIVKCFGIDDWFMVAAALCYIMFTTCAVAGVHYGTGRHFADLTFDNSLKALRYWWLCYIAYTLTMIFAKISIGFFLLRVTVARLQRIVIYCIVFTTVLVGIVFLFVTVFECTPVSYFWNRAQDGQCLGMNIIISLTYFYGSVSAICDFTFGLLPVFLVWKLQMDRRVKIILIPILGMGCVAAIAVLVRMAFVQDFADPDFLYATVDIAIWSDIEQGLAITAGSLACLRPLVHLVASKLNLSTVKMPQDGDQSTRNNPSRRKTPNVTGTYGLVSFVKDDKVRLSSQDNNEALRGTDGYGDANKYTWTVGHSENESEEELRSTPEAVRIREPPRAYATSESIGGRRHYAPM